MAIEMAMAMKVVLAYLDGTDVAKCMLVCKEWKCMGRDDSLWRCLCIKEWPSIKKRPPPPHVTFHQLYGKCYKNPATANPRRTPKTRPPSLSFDGLEFYIDISGGSPGPVSKVVSGATLRRGIRDPPSGACDKIRAHLTDSEKFKMIVPSRFPFGIKLRHCEVKVLVLRKDSNKIATLVHQSLFNNVDSPECRALAVAYLPFDPFYTFLPFVQVWVSLLFTNVGEGDSTTRIGSMDVFGIELELYEGGDRVNSEEGILWLLHMLNWK